ncbi:MAG: TonB-dependent receptor [Tannerella sp.]|jgi:outer membrane receptor for ferrienterochelin and colicin|nr:TonB-dependent receptor [Tannerella sp.]
MIRKLIFTMALLLFVWYGYSQEYPKVTLEMKDATLQAILKQLEQQIGYSFVYNETVNLDHKKTISVQNQPLQTVLDLIFSQTGIRWKISKRHIILTPEKQYSPKQKVTVSGYITDSESSEILIGANIYDRISGMGTATNEFGFYSLTLPSGEVDLRFSYTGYETEDRMVDIKENQKIDIQLKTHMILDEVVVYGDKSETGITATQMSAIDVPLNILKNTPSLLGEADVMKTLQMLPGVQAGTEGSAGVYVRGGGPDENLILLDGIPLYNVDHVFGFFSVFTPEAIKKVSLFKGSFPARFGGRLSSVIDVRTNDGDMHNYHGTVSLGLVSSKLQLEGPIWKGRTSFHVSGRRSYLDLLARPFMPDDEKYGYYFYDLNAKINHIFNNRSRLFFSFYNGRDHLNIKYTDNYEEYETGYKSYSSDENNLQWGNTLLAARWNYIFSPKLFSNTTVAFTDYNFRVDSKWDDYVPNVLESNFNTKCRSGIKDWAFKMDFDYYPLPRHHVKFGLGYLYHDFKPEVEVVRVHELVDQQLSDTIHSGLSNSHIYANEVSVYAEDNFDITPRLSVNTGLHFSLFNVKNTTYASLQPRFSARYQLTDAVALKASYTKMNQYIHLLSSYTVTLPTDIWVPATDRIKPMRSHQYSLGGYYTGIQGWEFSAETYYKDMRNILEYKDGSTFLGSSHNWEEKVEMGRGRAYGLELMAQKTTGKTTGWLAYTLAKSERQFDKKGINRGRWFPYRYDRRHHINLTLNHTFNDRIDVGASWEFYTGGTTTLAEEMTVILSPSHGGYGGNYGGNVMAISETDFVDRRNNYRLPSSHRLNLGVNFRKKKKHGERIWNISIYNIYNAMNPAFVYRDYYQKTTDGTHYRRVPILKKVTILPIVPSVSYTYRF